MSEKKTLSIHSENILPIIKKWLYSEKDIFLRELVSNASDALNKIKVLQSHGVKIESAEELRIDITIDPSQKTLKISDNGIGMTEEEVEKYIAQIAFSGATEFLEKYQSSEEKDQIIGHFGLGFYSSYMVAEKVEIETLSYLEGKDPAFWSCDGSSEYFLTKGKQESRGTILTLFLHKEHLEYLEEKKVEEILLRFCPFLPFPIYLNGKHINNKDPLWIKSPQDCTEKDYLDFYQVLYPMDNPPLFWVHLNIDYPFRLKGILYFPKIQNFEFNKSFLKLFCNRVFVSDHCKDLFPDYLTILKGALDSAEIPLNVSRSYLQVDQTVKQLGTHIAKKMTDKLQSIFSSDPQTFYSYWSDIEVFIKLGILQDEKFYDRVKTFLIWPSTEQEGWTTLEAYLERNKEKVAEKVFYSHQEKDSPLLKLFKDQGIEVIFTQSPIDTPLLSVLEKKCSCKFQRVDGGLEQKILDPTREKHLLDAEGKTEGGKLSEFVRKALPSVEVEAKSLAGDFPGFILLKEEERRVRDYFSFSREKAFPLGQKTFVVNTNSRLIQNAYKLSLKDLDLAHRMIQQTYRLALFSQKELDPSELTALVSESQSLLEHFSSL